MASPFGQILLITGNAEFEAERLRKRAVAAVTAEQPDCQISESTAAGLAAGELMSLTSPSLFCDTTAVVLTELEDLPDDGQSELLVYAQAPSPEVAVVLVHSGGAKAKGLLEKLRAAPSVTEVKVEQPKYDRGYAELVQREVRSGGHTIEPAAALALVEAVGHDSRALAGAVSQLIAVGAYSENGTPAQGIGVDLVRQYFGGRAEVRGYEIADAVLSGRLHTAMEANRWAELARTAPLLIIAAVASGLRTLAKLQSAPSQMRDAELASLVGAPPFKLRALKNQLAGWESAGLAQAIAAVAATDVALKNGETEPGYAIERMLLNVASTRRTN